MGTKHIHLLESYKHLFIDFFIRYGDDGQKNLDKHLSQLESSMRDNAYYYICRKAYDPQDVLDVLDTIKDASFLKNGLAGVDIKDKEIIMTRMHTIFKNLRNYIGILKNWGMKR